MSTVINLKADKVYFQESKRKNGLDVLSETNKANTRASTYLNVGNVSTEPGILEELKSQGWENFYEITFEDCFIWL
jgi:hypothetical protein